MWDSCAHVKMQVEIRVTREQLRNPKDYQQTPRRQERGMEHIHLPSPHENQPCPHLGLRLVSRIMRTYISTQFVALIMAALKHTQSESDFQLFFLILLPL